jgi:hypothetical protein
MTLLGMVTVVKPMQPENASRPIIFTLFGMVIDNKLVQPENAKSSILITLLGIMLFLVPDMRVLPDISIMLFPMPAITLLYEFRIRLFPSLRKCVLPVSTSMVSKFGVFINGFILIDVTLFGMVMEVKLVQPQNAQSSIVVTLFGMVIEVKLVQP